jgi:hypothetical protein
VYIGKGGNDIKAAASSSLVTESAADSFSRARLIKHVGCSAEEDGSAQNVARLKFEYTYTPHMQLHVTYMVFPGRTAP